MSDIYSADVKMEAFFDAIISVLRIVPNEDRRESLDLIRSYSLSLNKLLQKKGDTIELDLNLIALESHLSNYFSEVIVRSIIALLDEITLLEVNKELLMKYAIQ